MAKKTRGKSLTVKKQDKASTPAPLRTKTVAPKRSYNKHYEKKKFKYINKESLELEGCKYLKQKEENHLLYQKLI